MMSDSIGICKALHNQEDKLRQHSIYILSDDSDTDFDFYVLVDSKEAREKNEFLKKLFHFLNNNDSGFADPKHKEELKNSSDLTVLNWLKIAIEKYPYRLFVAVDKVEEYKNKSCKSKFIKKRICWIDKNKLKEAFNQDNKNILEIKELNDKNEPVGNNILIADDQKFSWQERAKLWLYYKWVEHLINNKLQIQLNIGIDTEIQEQFYPITLFSSTNISKNREFFVNNSLLFSKIKEQNYHLVSFSRHAAPVLAAKNWENYSSYFHSQGVSGVQYQLAQLLIISSEEYIGLKTAFGAAEQGLYRIFVCDERFVEWFEALSPLDKIRMFWTGIFPVERIKYNKKEFNVKNYQNFLLNINSDKVFFQINMQYLEQVLQTAQKSSSEYPNDCKTYFINEMNNLKTKLENDAKNLFSVLIIHQGLIDENKELLKHELLTLMKDLFPGILITSGRGKPDTVFTGEKFLPFSTLSFIMNSYPEKFIFTKLMMSSIERG